MGTGKRGRKIPVTSHKRHTTKPSSHSVKRDAKTGKFVTNQSDKNAKVLAATVGGAVIGNIIVPGLGGAILGAIAGALVGNSADGDSNNG